MDDGEKKHSRMACISPIRTPGVSLPPLFRGRIALATQDVNGDLDRADVAAVAGIKGVLGLIEGEMPLENRLDPDPARPNQLDSKGKVLVRQGKDRGHLIHRGVKCAQVRVGR